jgi:hypothetical protein
LATSAVHHPPPGVSALGSPGSVHETSYSRRSIGVSLLAEKIAM